jgi:PAS domain S-box-containing protein
VERERISQLKNMQQQMTTLINTVQEGIVATDRYGKVVNLNTSAAKMMKITPEEALGADLSVLLSGLSLDSLLERGKDLVNREVYRMIKGRRVYYIVTVKPWMEEEGVCGAVATLRELSEVRKFVSHLSTQVHCYTFEMILGNSPAVMRTKQEAAQAATGSATVLIQGESGTGKELFARAIHCTGERRDKPFIALNCAAIPEALLESELFGYEEGAFTGAKRGGKPGKFELADGGTVFLDEIGDMSLTLQSKLLRVLQERQIERVGGADSIPVDIRIIAATHKNIEDMVERGEFRQDLYYRVNVFPLIIPPLRHRREDEAYEWLLNYDWPGNVRELENTMEYLVNIETGPRISSRHIPQRIKTGSVAPASAANPTAASSVVPIAELEKNAILGALEKFGPTVEGKDKAAQGLGISKATLYRKLKEYEARPLDISK